jgi:hypothetical protein
MRQRFRLIAREQLSPAVLESNAPQAYVRLACNSALVVGPLRERFLSSRPNILNSPVRCSRAKLLLICFVQNMHVAMTISGIKRRDLQLCRRHL